MSTKGRMMERLHVILAGRAAEEVPTLAQTVCLPVPTTPRVPGIPAVLRQSHGLQRADSAWGVTDGCSTLSGASVGDPCCGTPAVPAAWLLSLALWRDMACHPRLVCLSFMRDVALVVRASDVVPTLGE